MSNIIQDLLRDKPPVMIYDMGLGSREQSLPAHDTEPAPITATLEPGTSTDLPRARPKAAGPDR